jgi:carboxypeptidase PM20D1
MNWFEIFLCVVGGLCGALLIIMLLRTILLRARKADVASGEHPLFAKVCEDNLSQTLSGAVKIPTITLQLGNTGGENFLLLHAFLEKSYPLVMQRAKKTVINSYSVIYAIEGSNESLNPIAVMGHLDVVPAPAEGWEVPPFSGEIKDGFVYGRGSQDMKGQIVASLQALETLLSEGFEINRGIYFCFGHDEELRGTEGAMRISAHLQSLGLRFELIIDEGGTILDGKMLGIQGKVALIGICEKGYADILLTAEVNGGHASTPPKKTALGMISEAVLDIQNTPMRPFLSRPTRKMFDTLAPHMGFLFRFLFINRWITEPLIKFIFKFNNITNSTVRTTLAPTQAKGAAAPNVLPCVATANINCRINTGQTIADATKHIKAVVGSKIKVEVEHGFMEASPIANINTSGYAALEQTIKQTFGAVPAPFMFNAASDATHYYNVSDNVYRFTPFEITQDDGKRIHAINERQSIAQLKKGVEFYIRLYENIIK